MLGRARSVAAHTLAHDARQVQFHYDLSDDFYALWLDPRRVYSCAYYRSPELTLAQAQEAKLDHICRKLRLEPGQRARPIEGPLYEYLPDEAALFDFLAPKYLKGMIYGALVESFASEQMARMTAMDAASKNAKTMLERLNLLYNRARQAAITREVTEIVAGAAALE